MPNSAEVRARMLREITDGESQYGQDFTKLVRLLDLPDGMGLTDMVIAAGLDRDLFREVRLESRDLEQKDISGFTAVRLIGNGQRCRAGGGRVSGETRVSTI
jgi:hypothetical protein